MAATVVRHNPAHPDEILTKTPATGRAGVIAAVDRARKAARSWAEGGAGRRAAALHAAADRVQAAGDELASLVSREVGKPITQARGEVARTVAILRYYAQQPYDPVGSVHEPAAGAGLLFTRRAPYGVAGLITPWNFPLAIPVWKAAPALATGNCVVLKPAEPATACALRLGELLDEVLPRDVFAVVPGGAAEGGALGTPVQAGMGGQNAAIVLPDADIEADAAQLAAAIAGYAGQKCTVTKRVIAVGDPGPLRDALVAALGTLAVGDPPLPGTACGPLISEQARDAVLSAARSGGRVLTGGMTVGGDPGWHARPTLVDELPDGHLLATEEVFGPIAAFSTAPDLDAAIARANAVAHGLAASVHTADLDTALRCADRLDTGLVKVNAATTGVDIHLPFGGEKASSHSPREQGKAALDFYNTRTRTVTLLSPA
ncbi:aldehyde dehydrogenase family protein [Streptomyces sp. NPDC054813]